MISGDAAKAFTFYALTMSLALLVTVAVPVLGEASLLVTMMTPAIAATSMLAVISPEGRFRETLGQLGLDRGGVKGWPLAIAGPAIIHTAGIVILSVAGLSSFAAPEMTGPALRVAVHILAGLVISTLLALGEEIGWRGYMLPHLRAFGAVPAMLLVGFLHGLWHLPLMLSTDYYHSVGNSLLVVPLFLVTLTLAGVFYGFLRIWTGSVWPVAIAHSAANFAWQIASELTQTKSDVALEYVGGESGLVMICGLLAFDAVLIRKMRGQRFMRT